MVVLLTKGTNCFTDSARYGILEPELRAELKPVVSSSYATGSTAVHTRVLQINPLMPASN